MERELRITNDGSHTMYVKEMGEPYHSIHGAVQESRHVFLEQGFNNMNGQITRILEIGFGTGLNALLTLVEAKRQSKRVYYHAVEKYPLDPPEYEGINHEQFIPGCPAGSFLDLHGAPWGREVSLTDSFTIFKEKADFREMDPAGPFDLVYFDAFDPLKQPHLWTEEIFDRIFQLMNRDGIMVTYSAKGSVRRALVSCGFRVEKVPGPPGKREMIRSFRI
jgi:tRNA U34 5-methylaminomethyl-2-thiouridine-forming methyltransferase MnmC